MNIRYGLIATGSDDWQQLIDAPDGFQSVDCIYVSAETHPVLISFDGGENTHIRLIEGTVLVLCNIPDGVGEISAKNANSGSNFTNCSMTAYAY